MSDVYLSVVLADGRDAEATRAAWTAGLRAPSEVVVRPSRNAGIRQACGEFVVATKAGVIPSAEALALVNARGLDAGAIYRADVLEEQAGVRRLWTREGCSRVSAEGGDGSVVLVEAARDWGAVAGLPASEFLHVKAAEEFVMMSRAWWMALRGWPEIRIATEFVETLFCYSAHYAGLREVILAEPFRCGARDVGKAEGAIDEARVRGWVTQMRRLGAPMIFNRGDWGKAGALPAD